MIPSYLQIVFQVKVTVFKCPCIYIYIYIPRKRKRHTLEEEEELSEEEHKVKTNEFDDVLPFMGDLKEDTTGQDMSFQI